MKHMMLFLAAASPLFAQQALSPIQAAVIREDLAELERLSSQDRNWIFLQKPSQTFEGELLLDFALANGKMGAYQFILSKGALPAVSTLFTAVKGRNYETAKALAEANDFKSYRLSQPPLPRYTISNKVNTNIRAVFNTNIITNLSQFAVTNALGQLTVREYTNLIPFVSSNFYTNIQSQVLTNLIEAPQRPAPVQMSTLEFTNITVFSVTNYTNTYQMYSLSNERGQILEREYTNSVPVIQDSPRTNIVLRAVATEAPAPPPSDYTPMAAAPTRLQYIDLARMAEAQGASDMAVYFLERAQNRRP